MNHSPVNTLGTFKISLQSAVLHCEVKDALTKAGSLLRECIKTRLPEIDNLYFPVPLLTTQIQKFIEKCDCVGDACEVKITAERNTIVLLAKAIIGLDDIWHLIQQLPIRNHELAPLLNMFK